MVLLELRVGVEEVGEGRISFQGVPFISPPKRALGLRSWELLQRSLIDQVVKHYLHVYSI